MGEKGTDQIQASDPLNCVNTSGVYFVKSERMITLTFGLLVMESGRARRVIQIRDVIEGWARAWLRTSLPMKPVEPESMTCMAIITV